MPNGKPLIPNLEVLRAFACRQDWDNRKLHGPWINHVNYLACRFDLHEMQVYRLLDRPRFYRWIEYGVSIRWGWLTPEGEAELTRLEEVERLVCL